MSKVKAAVPTDAYVLTFDCVVVVVIIIIVIIIIIIIIIMLHVCNVNCFSNNVGIVISVWRLHNIQNCATEN